MTPDQTIGCYRYRIIFFPGGAVMPAQSLTTPTLDPDAPTVTMTPAAQQAAQGRPSLTRLGALMGIPQYMSPEQAERQETDARTDLFSFGVVLYEAITGTLPFSGKTLESLIGRILTEEPTPITTLKPVTPYPLWSVIRRCLVKDRDRRMQTARELHTELQHVHHEMRTGTVLVDARTMPTTRAISFWRQPLALGFAAGMLVNGILGTWLLKPEPPPRPRTFTVPIEASGWTVNGPALSPDGMMIAYTNFLTGLLHIHDLAQGVSHELAGIVGAQRPFRLDTRTRDWIAPALSPDGRPVAVSAVEQVTADLITVT